MDLAREETQTHRPDQRILPHSHLTGVRDTMINIHAHSRMTGRVPMQANVSQTAMLDKKNGVDGPAGLRIIHIFCGWWRFFHRVILHVEGAEFAPPPWAYGGIAARRREAIMAAMQIVTWKAQQAHVGLAAKSYDARAAFHSGDPRELKKICCSLATSTRGSWI